MGREVSEQLFSLVFGVKRCSHCIFAILVDDGLRFFLHLTESAIETAL
jgi:hypothetical protein